MSEALAKLANACGIAREYHDIWGGLHPTTDSARRDLLAAMHFDLTRDPAALLTEWQAEQRKRKGLPTIETATRCFLPSALQDDGRLWGLSVQL
jgi:hypothetical protein